MSKVLEAKYFEKILEVKELCRRNEELEGLNGQLVKQIQTLTCKMTSAKNVGSYEGILKENECLIAKLSESETKIDNLTVLYKDLSDTNKSMSLELEAKTEIITKNELVLNNLKNLVKNLEIKVQSQPSKKLNPNILFDSYTEDGKDDFKENNTKPPFDDVIYGPTTFGYNSKHSEQTIQKLKEKLSTKNFLNMELKTNESKMLSDISSLRNKVEMLNIQLEDEKFRSERLGNQLRNERNLSKSQDINLNEIKLEYKLLLKKIKTIEESLQKSECEKNNKQKMVERLQRRLALMEEFKKAQTDLINNLQIDLSISKSKNLESN